METSEEQKNSMTQERPEIQADRIETVLRECSRIGEARRRREHRVNRATPSALWYGATNSVSSPNELVDRRGNATRCVKQ
jgi:hypothetical protein